MNKLVLLSLTIAALLIAGALLFSDGGDTKTATRTGGSAAVASAEVIDGVQYVDITARGGYTPRITKAQAGVPTVIRMKTENTFDCSMALAIPDLGYQSYLKPSGVEEIQVPAEKAQGTLKGLCSMAMYHFQIDFE